MSHATAPQPVRDDAAGPELQTSQQALEEALGGRAISPVLHENVEHNAVLVHH